MGLGVVGCDARQGHCGPVVARVGVGEVRLGTCCRVLHLLHPRGRRGVARGGGGGVFARGRGCAEAVEGAGVVAGVGQEVDKKPRPNRVLPSPGGVRSICGAGCSVTEGAENREDVSVADRHSAVPPVYPPPLRDGRGRRATRSAECAGCLGKSGKGFLESRRRATECDAGCCGAMRVGCAA